VGCIPVLRMMESWFVLSLRRCSCFFRVSLEDCSTGQDCVEVTGRPGRARQRTTSWKRHFLKGLIRNSQPPTKGANCVHPQLSNWTAQVPHHHHHHQPPVMPITPGDPWARRCIPKRPIHDSLTYRDAWRYKGMFSAWERFRPKHTFPGLGIGTGAFFIYLAADYFFKPSHGHDKAGHSENHE
jgi:hypothetical protein